MEGKVKWFNEVKGYGIVEDDIGNSYFIEASDIKKSSQSKETPKPDQKVKFQIDKENFKPDIPRAKDITIL